MVQKSLYNSYFIQGIIFGIIGLVFSLLGGSIANKYDIYKMAIGLMVLFIVVTIVKIVNILFFDASYWVDILLAYGLCANFVISETLFY